MAEAIGTLCMILGGGWLFLYLLRRFDKDREFKAKKVNPLGEVKIRRKTGFRREMVEKLLETPRMWLQSA